MLRSYLISFDYFNFEMIHKYIEIGFVFDVVARKRKLKFRTNSQEPKELSLVAFLTIMNVFYHSCIEYENSSDIKFDAIPLK